MSSNSEILCNAINSRRIVEFEYNDEQVRQVEPYVVWRGNDGTLNLQGWSLGYSKSNALPEWRTYNLAAIHGYVIITEDSFSGTRSGYNPNSHKYANAFCKIIPD